MSHKFLHRDDAPFAESIWEKIDAAVVGAAKSQLSARRLLHVDGPYGLGLKDVPGSDEEIEGKGQHAELSISRPRPVAMIRREFALPIRDIASYEQTQLTLDLNYGPETATDSFDDTGVELAYLGEPGQPFGEPNVSTTLSLPSGIDYADIGAAGRFVEVFLFLEDDPDAAPLVWLGHWPEQNEAVAHLIVPPAAYEISACLFINGSIYNDEAPGPTILQGDYAGYCDSGTPTTIPEEGTTEMDIELTELEEDL